MITYRKFVEVRLEGKIVGKIVQLDNGHWQYRPKRAKKRGWGSEYSSLPACKASLEG